MRDGSTHNSPAEHAGRAFERRSRGLRTFDGVGIADGQAAARALLAQHPQRFVLVVRGAPRSAIFNCPCECGDTVVINLDRAVGPAWRLRIENEGVTLMPSVFRISGCRSHFIIWRSTIWWCHSQDATAVMDGDQDELEDWPAEMDAELRDEWRRIRAEHARPRRR